MNLAAARAALDYIRRCGVSDGKNNFIFPDSPNSVLSEHAFNQHSLFTIRIEATLLSFNPGH
jgi:hypothetical protein